jgi:ribosomal protein S18 acetylase RimI-like enzyme
VVPTQVTTVEAARRAESFLQGVQPFRPVRDLEAGVDLLQGAFRDELGAKDLAWLADLGMLGQGPAWVRLLLRLAPPAAGFFTGFVWYEGGRLVGNVSLMRVGPGAWVVANVATHPEFRRRGIGARLVRAAVEQARSGGAHAVGLQVRSDNAAAIALYEREGFARVGAATSFRGEASVPAPHHPPGVAVRPWTPGRLADVTRVAALAGALEGAWPPGPLRQSLRHRGYAARLDAAMRGRERRGWCVSVGGDTRGVGIVLAERVPGQHTAEFAVAPAARGAVEDALLGVALSAAQGLAGSVTVEVPEQETGVSAWLVAAGYVPVRTLNRMVLPLS